MGKKQPEKGSAPASSPSASGGGGGGEKSVLRNGIQAVSPDSVSLRIHAKPGAKANNITDISKEEIGIAIAAPPRDGEANEALVEYLADILNIRKSAVSLSTGGKGRNKVFLAQGISLDQAVQRFATEFERLQQKR